jgi:hypothetical protein
MSGKHNLRMDSLDDLAGVLGFMVVKNPAPQAATPAPTPVPKPKAKRPKAKPKPQSKSKKRGK